MTLLSLYPDPLCAVVPDHRANLGAGFTPAKFQLGGDSFPKTLDWIATKVARLPTPQPLPLAVP